MNDLANIFDRIGMKGDEIHPFIQRIVQYLILDFAVYSLEINGIELTEHSLNSFLMEKLHDEAVPSVAALKPFVDAYKFNRGNYRVPRSSISTGNSAECDFLLGCPISDSNVIESSSMNIEIQKDHIIPLSWSGNDSPTNIQFLCKRHNRLKWDGIFWDQGILPIEGWNLDI